jgi:sorting nexin-1/2
MADTSGMIKYGNVIKYTISGVDSEGKFEIQRRYKEFDSLHNALLDRWPGCYVPAIPEKAMVGDKDDNFVEQRRSLLERFMRECGKYEYLIESKEFKIFSRSPGEVDKTHDQIPRQTPLQILEKYRLNFKLDEDQDTSEIARYRDKINIFNAFLTKAVS